MPLSIGPYGPEELIDVIEADLIDASVLMGRSREGVVFRGSDVCWVYTGHKTLNRIMRARFRPDEAEDRVAEVFDCFRRWDAPVSWVVGPSTYPPQLHDYLRDQGFGNGGTLTGLAMEVRAWKSGPPIDGVRVELVNGPEAMRQWASIPTPGWETDESNGTTPIFAPDNGGPGARARYYLATDGGKPVGRLVAFTKRDVLGLHWPAVVDPSPIERTRVERALVDRAMADGADCVVAVAVTSKAGTLERAGFKPYCQFAVYAWPPAPLKMTAS